MQPPNEHPYTTILRRHRAIIAAGLISPYGQMKKKVLTEKQKAETDQHEEEHDDN